MILAGLLGAFVSLALGEVPDDAFSRKLSVELEAAPAERLLPELGKAYGVRLRAEGQTRYDVLVISVKEVTLKDLMARIARIDSAEWQKAPDGGYELIRTSELKVKQEKADQKALTELMRKRQELYAKQLPPFNAISVAEAAETLKTVAQLNDELQKQDPNTSIKARIVLQHRREAAEANLPLQRLAQRVLLGLDPAFLASVPLAETVTYSDRPNRAQLQLPLDLRRFNAEFFKTHRTYFEASGNTLQPQTEDRLANALIGERLYQEPPRKSVVRLISGDRGTLYLYMLLIRDEKTMEYGSNASLPDLPVESTVEKRDSAPFLDSVSEKTRRLLTEMSRVGRLQVARSPGVMDAEIRKLLVDPVVDEPLAMLSGAALLAVAHERKQNLVAVLSDRVASWVMTVSFNIPQTVLEAERKLLEDADLDLQYSKDWIEVQPTYPSENWKERVDRRTLKSIFQLADGLNPGLVQSSKLVAQLPRTFQSGIASLAEKASMNGPRFLSQLGSEYDALRFYGKLNPGQIASLAKGETLRVGNLSLEQKQALFNAIYQGNIQLNLSYPADSKGWIPPLGYTCYEKTEILTDGLQANTTFTMTTEEETRVIGNAEGSSYQQPQSAQELANLVHMSEHREIFGDHLIVPTQFHLMQQKKIILNFVFTPETKGQLVYVENEQDPVGRWLSFKELPQAFRDAYDKELKEMNQYRYIKE
jgi:hypothetical protein